MPEPALLTREGSDAPGALRRIVVYGNPVKPGIGALLDELAAWAEPRGMALSVAREIAVDAGGAARASAADNGSGAPFELYDIHNAAECPFRAGEPALLLSLGGDGTMLHAIHRFWPLLAPVMGINLGSLGFNASVMPDCMIAQIERWMRGAEPAETRMLLKVRRLRAGRAAEEFIAVNDVVMAKQVEAHVIHIVLRQGRETIASYAGDGLIVSTPTGSTAYNLSAGGPIVNPVLRVVVATAICPHTLAARPVVLAPEPPLEMEFVLRHTSDRVMLLIDNETPLVLAPGDRITIEAAELPLRLVAGEGYQYFNQLRQKLLWNVENKPAEPEAP